ncbi:TetR/AcrR family transcriptional regulator [Mycobacterium deserti]|uniref:TetR/AcrR family transcriptional regulator n=1 Tax=Mycobacterium deserti TaxID=2978347 RepID=A0ABT2M547_9MYCO|nr:TetR/AcrR family transcriptional regulator [Mycobacterium deserti]MCT7657071.1 TetR/AcrR family transcriptional regulator [Mycobacterium deserti]
MAGESQRVRRGAAPGLLQEAARELFAERGYAATTREIATRAGVSHDLIFRYFESKEKLFFDAVATPLLDAVGGLHQRWLDDPVLATMDHDRMIRRFTVGFYDFMAANQPIARAMVHLFVSESTEGEVERLRERVSDTLAPMVAPIDAYLATEGLRHSSPALQLRLAMLFVGVAATFLRNTYPADDEVPGRDEIVDELSRFISNGLRAD